MPMFAEMEDYIATLGPIVLSVMGAFVSIKAFEGGWKRFWVAASFVVVGLLTAWGIVISINAAKKEQQEVHAVITGGDHYSYFMSDESDLRNRKKKIRLWIHGTGTLDGVSVWISPLGVGDPNDPAYWSIGGAYFPRVHKGGVLSGVALPPGQYRIDLLARNGLVVQSLTIVEFRGELIQVFDIVRDGKTLLRSQRPQGFPE